MKSRAWPFIIAGFIVLALAAIFVLPKLRPYSFHGTLIQSPEVSPDITMVSHTGQLASLSDFRGKWVFLYFGYTYCPDVCPATLAEIHNALEIIGPRAEEVQVLMITVDPERDTPAALSQYLSHFGPNFLGLIGTPEQLADAAALYGVYYGKSESSEGAYYLMDHTASQMLIDPEGHLKLVYPFGTPGEDLAEDLAYLIK